MGKERYHSLDAARGLLMLVGIYFHIIVFHYGQSWLGPVGMGTHYFRMHTFFLISGFFSALVLYRKGTMRCWITDLKESFYLLSL